MTKNDLQQLVDFLSDFPDQYLLIKWTGLKSTSNYLLHSIKITIESLMVILAKTKEMYCHRIESEKLNTIHRPLKALLW